MRRGEKMNKKQLKKIVIIIVLISSIVMAIKFVEKYKVSQYSKQINTAIKQKKDVETVQNILNQCPDSVNSLPSTMPYIIRLLWEVPEIFYPLQEACNWRNYEMVKLLIENGADVNCASPGLYSSATPLIQIVQVHTQALWMGESMPIDEIDLDIIRLLLEKGADKSIKDEQGKTAYDYAVDLHETDLAELLEY